MNYGTLFSKAWNLIWEHKFLILLGMLVVLGGVGSGSGGNQGFSNGDNNVNIQNPPQFDLDITAPLRSFGLPTAAIVWPILILSVLLVFWVIGTISRGGLIYGAEMTNRNQATNFADSLRAGWAKGWRLIGIGLVPAIPMVLLLLVAFLSAGFYAGGELILQEGSSVNFPKAVVMAPVLAVTCILIPLALALSLLRTFANRACMLENLSVWASYRRGLEVLGNNLGAVFVLFLLQIGISIVLGLVLFLPGVLIALCCFLWPLIWVAQGLFAAFYSTLWTLAWDQWTNPQPDQLTR